MNPFLSSGLSFMYLSGTNRPKQEEQSDQGLHCLSYGLYLLAVFLHCKVNLFLMLSCYKLCLTKF